jgi:phospholipase/carboxylesterase
VRGDPERLADGVQRATARLAELLRELGEQERFVGKPVVTGFSQGGILSYSLAVHHPELISASVPIAGWLPPRIAPDSPPRVRVPIVALHGEEDRVVPFIQTHELASEMASLGFDLQLQTYPRVAHSINREVRDDWVRALTRLIARHEAHQ